MNCTTCGREVSLIDYGHGCEHGICERCGAEVEVVVVDDQSGRTRTRWRKGRAYLVGYDAGGRVRFWSNQKPGWVDSAVDAEAHKSKTAARRRLKFVGGSPSQVYRLTAEGSRWDVVYPLQQMREGGEQ